jgi:flagellar P-ring protein precursor FlgI
MKIVSLFIMITISLFATTIKDIANVQGVRDNQLVGYGLVVGLNGTGDSSSSQFTRQAISSMLKSVNVKVDSKKIKSKNVAAVVVTATLPPFSRHGDKIDIEVSSIGDAKSIVGGTLLLTPLKAVDGEIYAIAQGEINTGFSPDKRNTKKASSAKVFGGAIVEREVDFDLYHKRDIRLSLKESNFDTVVKIQKALNRSFGRRVAVALDPRTVELRRPESMSMVEFLARVNNTNINYNQTNRVVIDEKTGTIVAGVDVKVLPVVITHKDLTLKIEPTNRFSKPSKTKKLIGDSMIDLENNTISIKKENITVANIARVLQKVGAKPSDIIEILQTIKRAGGITAQLKVI